MKRVALVKDGIVVNTAVVADDWPNPALAHHQWEPPEGHEAYALHPLLHHHVTFGTRHDGHDFERPSGRVEIGFGTPGRPESGFVDHDDPSVRAAYDLARPRKVTRTPGMG